MFIAGLTGGIATGKSTVSAFFKNAGATIIDADKIVHELQKKGQPAWKKIVTQFGKTILLPSGDINRDDLAKIIFNDSQQQALLNSIIHPLVFNTMAAQIERAVDRDPDQIIILDVPLLIETNMHKTLPEIILVYAPADLQIGRLMARNQLTRNDALLRIQSQMPIDAKKALATIIIDNSHSIEDTRNQTWEVYATLIKKQRRLPHAGLSYLRTLKDIF